MPNPRPRVERIGHRGAPREFPENSLPAFARAIELGADAIELDVHKTVDNVVVVHHDPDIRGDSSSRKTKRPLHGMRWLEVAEMELAPGIRIPTLAQVLSLVGTRATVYV